MKELRQEDLFARFGGEEFALVLPGTSLASAGKLLLRLKSVVSGLMVRHEQRLITVTASFGMASHGDGAAFRDAARLRQGCRRRAVCGQACRARPGRRAQCRWPWFLAPVGRRYDEIAGRLFSCACTPAQPCREVRSRLGTPAPAPFAHSCSRSGFAHTLKTAAHTLSVPLPPETPSSPATRHAAC